MEEIEEYTPRKKEIKPRPGRGENWTKEERDVFLEIMRHSDSVVENKLTDSETNKKKHYEWLRVQKKLKQLNGRHRSIAQLKGFWSRLKTQAKKNNIVLKDGACRESLVFSPSEQDQKIIVLCQPDFDSDIECYDKIDSSKDGEETSETHNSTFYDSNNEDTREGMNASETKNTFGRKDLSETGDTYKEILASNHEWKNQSKQMLQEEHDLKMKYHQQELIHQQLRHKLEIDILLLDKQKKELEISVLKKSLK